VAVALLSAAGRAGQAGSGSFTVSATVLSKSNCKFDSKAAVLAFGTLDPADGSDVTTTTTIGFRCTGSAPIATFAITDDDGLYESGPDANRMRHATLGGQYLPYEMALSPVGGTVPKNEWLTLTVTGTVRGDEYANAYAGDYSDTVVISIDP
jgi:spore coat protein U-like protein